MFLVRQLLLLTLLPILCIAQTEEKWQQWRAIQTAAYADEPRDPIEAQAVGEEIRAAIQQQNPATAAATIADELIDFTIGLTWLHAGEYAKARASFHAEVEQQRALGRTIYGNSRNPQSTAREVMEFQAVLNAHKISTAGLDLGYESWPVDVDGDGVYETLFRQITISNDEGGYVTGKIDSAQEQRERYQLYRASGAGSASLIDQQQIITSQKDATAALGRRGQGAVLHVSGVTQLVGHRGQEKGALFVYPSPASTLVLELTAKGIHGIPGPEEGMAESSAATKSHLPVTSRADRSASSLRAIKEPAIPAAPPPARQRSYWSIFFPVFFVGTLIVAALLLKRAHAHA